MDTRSSIWLPCPLCIVNKEFGNNQAVPEIRTPRHLFRTWGLYRRLHLSRISVLSARCRYMTTRKKLWLYTVFCFFFPFNFAQVKWADWDPPICCATCPCTATWSLGHFMAWKRQKDESTRWSRCRKGRGKKGWGGERGYDALVAIHLRGFGIWSWPKKNADCLYSDATNRHTNTQRVKWLFVNNSESN